MKLPHTGYLCWENELRAAESDVVGPELLVVRNTRPMTGLEEPSILMRCKFGSERPDVELLLVEVGEDC